MRKQAMEKVKPGSGRELVRRRIKKRQRKPELQKS
jgi:hypothetical protein